MRHRLWGKLLFIFLTTVSPLWANWFTESSKEPAYELAGKVPEDSFLAAAWNLGPLPGENEFLSRLPEESHAFIRELPAMVGLSIDSLFSWFTGRGYFALSPSTADAEPGFMLAVELANPAEFDLWLSGFLEQSFAISSEGSAKKFSPLGRGPLMILQGDWFVITRDLEKARAHLQESSSSLAGTALFEQALQSLPLGQSNAYLFLNVTALAQEMERQSAVDAPEVLGSCEFAVLNVDFQARETLGFLKIRSGTPLSRTSSIPGKLDGSFINLLPHNMSTMLVGDGSWALGISEVVTQSSPEMQSFLGEFVKTPYGDLDKAFTGRVAYGTDVLDNFFELMDARTERYSKLSDRSKLTGCKSNLKNLGTAMEMYSTDWSGRYPTSMATLTPDYLRSIPECPQAQADTYSESLTTGKDAPGNSKGYSDYYAFECRGEHHPETPGDYPKYNSILGLVAGEELQPEEPESVALPNSVFVAEVKDLGEAHRFLTLLTEGPTGTSLTQCKSNLKNLGVAMEMYSTDWSGRYPTSTAPLVPDYLAALPKCPSAGQDTYSPSLQTGPDAPGNEEAYQDYYTFECRGHHHRELEPDHPRYNGIVGLDEGPRRPKAEMLAETPVTATPATVRAYKFPPGVLLLDPKSNVMVVATGGKAPALASAERSEELPLELKEGLRWTQGRGVYLAYSNLEPLYQTALVEVREMLGEDFGRVGAALLAILRDWTGELKEVQAVRATPEGLYYRGSGFNSSPGMGVASVVGGAVLVPNFIRARSQGQLTACKSNLKNLATGLEMYSTDYSGRYPEKLEMIVPEYLWVMPVCPAAGGETYTRNYQTGPDATGNDEGFSDYYYLECHGHHHKSVGVPENYPRYNGIEGIIER